MKNTKENVMNLLKKMIENTNNVLKIFEEKGDKETVEYYKGERIALLNALWLIEDNKYFNAQYKVFNKED